MVAMAPSVRTALGEDFLLGFGQDVTGKIYSALRQIGFEKVFDINFSADMTILEEGTELINKTMGQYTGAGTIFGATGGVMEAALRTTKELVEGVSLSDVDYTEVRGVEGIKEATVKIAGNEYNIAVINGAGNLFKFKNEGYLDKKQYHFIEVMACPGGCVNGGGQPFVSAKAREEVDFRKVRASVLYTQDKTGEYRKSHKNPALLAMYKDFMGEAGGEKAEELLHVVYKQK